MNQQDFHFWNLDCTNGKHIIEQQQIQKPEISKKKSENKQITQFCGQTVASYWEIKNKKNLPNRFLKSILQNQKTNFPLSEIRLLKTKIRDPFEIRNPKSETRNRKSEIKTQKSEIGNRESEKGNRKSEIGNRKSEIGNRKSEIGNRKSEIRNQKSEIGNRKSEIRNRKSKFGNRKSEIGNHKS